MLEGQKALLGYGGESPRLASPEYGVDDYRIVNKLTLADNRSVGPSRTLFNSTTG